MRQVPRSPLSFKLQRVENVPEHPPPSNRLMSCAHIANRRLSRIIGARWRRFVERHLPSAVIYLMVATLVAIVLYPHMVVTVPSGEVGVLWKRFGGGTLLDPRKLRSEGLRFIWPWNELFLYDLRVQSL